MRALRICLLTAACSLPASCLFAAEKPVHLFILSGQSNMQGMDPEAGFAPEAKRLFPEAEIVYLKVSRGGQPIRQWLAEWDEIAANNGLAAAAEDGETNKPVFYEPILEQYAGLIEEHGRPESVTFCWMQGERDAKGGTCAAYADSLRRLIANLRRDLNRTDMNVVVGRLSDHPGQPVADWNKVRDIQVEIAEADARGAWVDTDDLNNKQKNGKSVDDLHYTREGYAIFGKRLARQAAALIRGESPAKNGRPE